MEAKPIPTLFPMTPREKQIVEFIVEGFCNKQIASALDISLRTVKAHMSSVLQKMGVKSRYHVAVVTIAVRRIINK